VSRGVKGGWDFTLDRTRITVELILDKLSAGETVEQLLQAHPRLTEEGIKAALAFASKSAPQS